METTNQEVAKTPRPANEVFAEQNKTAKKADHPSPVVVESSLTNFFSLMAQLIVDDLDFTITMRRQGALLVVGVRPQYSQAKNTHINTIKPMMLTHNPEDLDKDFFETLRAGMTEIKSLKDQLDEFKSSLKEVKPTAVKSTPAKTPGKTVGKAAVKKAAPAKKAPAKPQISKEDKEKKANEDSKELMDAAEKLASEGKYDQALGKIKSAKLVKRDPAFEEVRKSVEKMKSLSKTRRELEPTIEKIKKFAASFNYGEVGKLMKDVLRKDPDNIKAGEIRVSLEAALGKPTVEQLLK